MSDDKQMTERVEPPAEDGNDEAYREYGRQLAMDALLEAALARTNDIEPTPSPRPTRKAGWRQWGLPVAAAAALLAKGAGRILEGAQAKRRASN